MEQESAYLKWATRPSCVAKEVPFAIFMTKNGLKRFLSIPVDKEKSDYYVHRPSYLGLIKKITENILDNPTKHFSDYNLTAKKLVESAAQVAQSLAFDNHMILEKYEAYYAAFIEYSLYLISPFAVEEYVIKDLSTKLPEHVAVITSPDRPLQYQEMRKYLLERGAIATQKEYGWMNVYNYQEEDYSVGYFEELAKTLTPQEITEIYDHIEKNRKQFKDFLATISDPEFKVKCEIAHQYAFIKTDRVDHLKMGMSLVRSLFRKLAEREGWTVEDATNLTYGEVREILLTGNYPALENIHLRAEKKCIFDIQGSALRIISDPKEIEELRREVVETVILSKEFGGTIASPGMARGKATIVTDKTELGKVKLGDILVAIFTTPDYVPVMKLAAGIITEEGGLTSHAAVISRELKKPCVMNIKHATQILKDGDLVEVDADKGTVRLVV